MSCLYLLVTYCGEGLKDDGPKESIWCPIDWRIGVSCLGLNPRNEKAKVSADGIKYMYLTLSYLRDIFLAYR